MRNLAVLLLVVAGCVQVTVPPSDSESGSAVLEPAAEQPATGDAGTELGLGEQEPIASDAPAIDDTGGADEASGSRFRTSFSPGIYFGTYVCDEVLREDGCCFHPIEEVLAEENTLVISDSGIPIRNGEEEHEGRTVRDSFVGVDFVLRVAEVSVFPDALNINIIALGNATTDDLRLDVREEVLYRPLSSGRIELTSDFLLSVFSVTSEITVSRTRVCRGIYSK